MPWRYEIGTGRLTDPTGILVGIGYSGRAGKSRNNFAYTTVRAVGPIPVGLYRRGPIKEGSHMGPYAIALIPCGGQDMYGRSAFYMHGDNASGDASQGCIIQGPGPRDMFGHSADELLSVTT